MMKRFTPKHAFDKALQALAAKLEHAKSTDELLLITDQIAKLADMASTSRVAHALEIHGKRSKHFHKALRESNLRELAPTPEDSAEQA